MGLFSGLPGCAVVPTPSASAEPAGGPPAPRRGGRSGRREARRAYATFFTKDFPCRSCVEVARLPKDVLIEIEAIALK